MVRSGSTRTSWTFSQTRPWAREDQLDIRTQNRTLRLDFADKSFDHSWTRHRRITLPTFANLSYRARPRKLPMSSSLGNSLHICTWSLVQSRYSHLYSWASVHCLSRSEEVLAVTYTVFSVWRSFILPKHGVWTRCCQRTQRSFLLQNDQRRITRSYGIFFYLSWVLDITHISQSWRQDFQCRLICVFLTLAGTLQHCGTRDEKNCDCVGFREVQSWSTS